jgi:Pyridoxamine 5'-phosphate oxidase
MSPSLIAFDVLLDRAAAARDREGMPTWTEFESAAPELAAEVRRLLDAHRHKTIATIRRDGSPRISGIETEIRDGELWTGSMWQARKALDLRRDRRFALHSGSEEPETWSGDAKLAGLAEEITDPERVREINGGKAPPGPSHLFRLDLREVSTVKLDDARTKLVITVWTPERGVRRIERA